MKKSKASIYLLGAVPLAAMGYFHLQQDVWFAYVELSMAAFGFIFFFFGLFRSFSFLEVNSERLVIANAIIRVRYSIEEIEGIYIAPKALQIKLKDAKGNFLRKLTYSTFGYNVLIPDNYEKAPFEIARIIDSYRN